MGNVRITSIMGIYAEMTAFTKSGHSNVAEFTKMRGS